MEKPQRLKSNVAVQPPRPAVINPLIKVSRLIVFKSLIILTSNPARSTIRSVAPVCDRRLCVANFAAHRAALQE
jgi:hypothetical protein